MSYTELAKEMIKADLNEHKDFYLTKFKDTNSFTEAYYQSTFKQGFSEETKEDFGYVLYEARVEEDNENELLSYAGKVFEELKENKIVQDKIVYGLLEKRYTKIFIDSKGKIFGYNRGLGATKFHYTILIEHNDNEKRYFEIGREVVYVLDKLNDALRNLGIYTGYYEGEFEHNIYEIVEDIKSTKDYLHYIKLFK